MMDEIKDVVAAVLATPSRHVVASRLAVALREGWLAKIGSLYEGGSAAADAVAGRPKIPKPDNTKSAEWTD
jgi:hypothetical protein